jgi:hypothetical protein
MTRIAGELSTDFARDNSEQAAQLFAPDAVLEDLTLHTAIVGRQSIAAYLARGLLSCCGDRSKARRSRSTASRPSGSLTAEPPANRPGSLVRNLRRRFRTLLACLTIGLRSFVRQRVQFAE